MEATCSSSVMQDITSSNTHCGMKHKLQSESDDIQGRLLRSKFGGQISPSAALEAWRERERDRPSKKLRTSQTVPSSPIWQMSPGYEINCDWAPPCGSTVLVGTSSSTSGGGTNRTLSQLVANKLKKERENLLEDWILELKRRQQTPQPIEEKQETLTEKHEGVGGDKSGGDGIQVKPTNDDLAAMRVRVREEVCAEYDRHLVQVESRLKNELESLEAREESLTSELRTRDSQLTEEKAKVKQCLEMLESELQCSICSELFINAVTLGCAHSFCEFCIDSWKRKPYSHSQCPICRATVTREVRSLVLDQYIERVVATLDPDLAQVRAELVQQRKELEEMQALKDKSERESNVASSGSNLLNVSHVNIGSSGNSNSGGSSNAGNFSSGNGSNVHSRINISGSGSSSGPVFSGSSRSSNHRYGRDSTGSNGRNSGGGGGSGSQRGSNRYGSHGNAGHHSGNSGGSRGYMSNGGGHRSSLGGGGASASGGGSHHGQAGYRGPFRDFN
ncbi:keratin, type I cytoskeletal 9-like isoform X2 [Symsagittifera roscoffensis]|uniref:keratin, type I cytoskeletal 9-like isoform X2 n=1 Tax=Symsagittifera roscoffensis TaxID=84072 RepID=UPI00307B6326